MRRLSGLLISVLRWGARLLDRARLAAVVGLLVAVSMPSVATDRFLPAEEAFRMSAVRTAPDRVALQFDIAPGYYMYRAAFAVQAEGATVGPLELPPGVVKFDENFGKNVETYHGALRVGVVLQGAGSGPVALTVQSQGCAEAGLCYPLATTRVRLDPANAVSTVNTAKAVPAAETAAAPGATGRLIVIAGIVAAAVLVAGIGVWWVRRR